METRWNKTPRFRCRTGLLVAFVASFFASAPTASAEGENNFLKRELKYVPVADALPRLAAVIGAIYGVEPETPEAKGAGIEPLLVGEMLLVADLRLNNLVVSGAEKHLDLADHFLKVIDVRPPQVKIDGVFLRIELGDDIEQGVDILRAVDEILVGGEKIDLSDAFTMLADGKVVAFGGGAFSPEHFDAYCEALQAKVDGVEIVSRPKVFTGQNQKAHIHVVPHLDLDVTSLINSDDEIILDLTTTLDAEDGDQVLQTHVRVPDQSVCVVGGIVQKDADGARSELLVLIRPELLPGEE